MKTLLLFNADILAFPAILALHESGNLSAVCIAEKNKALTLPLLNKAGIDERHVYALNKQTYNQQLQDIIRQYAIEVMYVIAFPWMIADEVLNLLPYGGINFHFGLLPKYKGADPMFWEIKNREKEGGISVHRMTNELDNGPLVYQQRVAIVPGETYGLFGQRLGSILPDLLPQIEEKVRTQTYVTVTDTNTEISMNAPTPEELTIDWQTQTAGEIEWLVNAANPKYTGAITTLRGNTIYLTEVSPADVNGQSDAPPGTIIYADHVYGLIVQCINNEFIKLNIARLHEGFVSGVKLFSLGVKVGEAFS